MIEGIIYIATNKKNGKSYIGQTICGLSHRISQHKYGIGRSNRKFYSALKHYGIDNFEWKTIGTYPVEQLNDKEKFYIDFYKTFIYGYNLTTGGNSHIVSEETKEKIRKSNTGKKHFVETKEKIRQSILDRKYRKKSIESEII